MASPFTPDQPFKDINVINESERSVDPTDDAGKLVQLESDGRISSKFQSSPLDYQEFLVNGTWTKPTTGSMALVEMQAPGGGGAARNETGRASASGGNGGGYIAVFIPMYLLESTVSVLLGAVGLGAELPAGTPATANGGKGGDCEFGDLVKVEGGLGGVAGAGSTQPAVPTKTYTSAYSIAESVEIIGGRGGSASGSSAGGTANPGENTKYTGAGGGSVGVGDGAAVTSLGGVSEYAGNGGNGVAGFTGNDGQNHGGGGGAALTRNNNSSLMKAGNGGAGYVRVYVF